MPKSLELPQNTDVGHDPWEKCMKTPPYRVDVHTETVEYNDTDA